MLSEQSVLVSAHTAISGSDGDCAKLHAVIHRHAVSYDAESVCRNTVRQAGMPRLCPYCPHAPDPV